MKTAEIAQKYGIDHLEFDRFLVATRVEYHTSLSGEKVIKDNKVEDLIKKFNTYCIEKAQLEEQKELEAKRQAEYKAELAKALSKMLITSGFSFEGYRIVKYSGYISGDDAVQVNRGTAGFFSDPTNVGEKLMQSLTIIRRNALRELKEAAYDLGCNAVIGVDFDYLTLDPQTANSSGGTTYLPYVFGVTANGNAVIIEKIEDDEA